MTVDGLEVNSATEMNVAYLTTRVPPLLLSLVLMCRELSTRWCEVFSLINENQQKQKYLMLVSDKDNYYRHGSLVYMRSKSSVSPTQVGNCQLSRGWRNKRKWIHSQKKLYNQSERPLFP